MRAGGGESAPRRRGNDGGGLGGDAPGRSGAGAGRQWPEPWVTAAASPERRRGSSRARERDERVARSSG